MNGLATIDLRWLQQQFPELSNLTPLSVGGQKLVFAATHNVDGVVVLKMIHPSQNAEVTRRELIAVSQVNSARVPRILESGTIATPVGNCFWFREQRIPGETLREALRGSRVLPEKEILRLGVQILETLATAEQVKIVHRDVKPENIIRDLCGNFWLIDFGIARHLDLQSLTATVSVFGKFTLGYAPPEQCRNSKPDIDGRCDLFALGVTLYECAAGRNPFLDGVRDDMEKLNRVESMLLPPLKFRFSAAQKFADLIAAMTQKRRDHRPLTVAEAYLWMNEICEAEGI